LDKNGRAIKNGFLTSKQGLNLNRRNITALNLVGQNIEKKFNYFENIQKSCKIVKTFQEMSKNAKFAQFCINKMTTYFTLFLLILNEKIFKTFQKKVSEN